MGSPPDIFSSVSCIEKRERLELEAEGPLSSFLQQRISPVSISYSVK